MWWVLGWIFIFPIPLTIIISRNKKLKTGAKIGIIAAAWIVYLLMGLAGKAIQDNEHTHADPPQASCVLFLEMFE